MRRMTRGTIGFLLAAMVVAGATGCARSGLQLKERSDSRVQAIVVGDVRTVERGEATERRMWSVPAGMLAAGVGTGAVAHDSSRQGTAMVLDGVGLVRSLDPGQHGRVETSANGLFSSYIVGIPPRANPAARYRVRGGKEGIELSRIYQELTRRHGDILFVVGTGSLVFSDTVALKAAPNREEDILAPANREKYFEPRQHEFGPVGVWSGIVLGDAAQLRGSNLRVFSSEPNHSGIVSRTNFARLSDLEGVSPTSLKAAAGKVVDVARLLPVSRVRDAELAVYRIEDFDKR